MELGGPRPGDAWRFSRSLVSRLRYRTYLYNKQYKIMQHLVIYIYILLIRTLSWLLFYFNNDIVSDPTLKWPGLRIFGPECAMTQPILWRSPRFWGSLKLANNYEVATTITAPC